MLFKTVISTAIIIIGLAMYLHVTAEERRVKRAKLRKIRKTIKYRQRFGDEMDDITRYFDYLDRKERKKQNIKCENPKLLAAAQAAYEAKKGAE